MTIYLQLVRAVSQLLELSDVMSYSDTMVIPILRRQSVVPFGD